jgi:NAD(P)-dependent dehydrogenase (short-subunit alcohol dehydrogenase family)
VSAKLKPLAEQVLVVTGASSGNGLAIAREAVRRGAAVVLAARNEAALHDVTEELRSGGGKVAFVAADVALESDVDRIAACAVETFGGFDTWINNAGAGLYGTLEEVEIADHRRVFDVNYFGTLYGSLAAARHLKSRGGGAIINIGSILGDRAIILQGPYSATKHAVQGLTDTLRMELERERANISVTLIKPGGCGTPYPEHARNYMSVPPRIPQPLYAPSVIADAVLFACETPRRSMYIGSGGMGFSLLSQLAPRLTDLVMEAVGAQVQQSRDDPGDPAKRDNLYEHRVDGTEKTAQRVWMRKSSLTVAAQKLPARVWFTAMAGLGVLAALHRFASRPRR